jgi:2'-5' RNA ligase
VALRPDAATVAQLDALAGELERICPRARRVAPENFHLTLAFIGALEVNHASGIGEQLAAIRAPDATWTIDRTGCFERARVVWAGGPTVVPLEVLVSLVRKGLDTLGIAYDRKAFLGHVTLLRRVADFRAQSLTHPSDWRLAQPELMVSEPNAQRRTRYRPWSEWQAEQT